MGGSVPMRSERRCAPYSRDCPLAMLRTSGHKGPRTAPVVIDMRGRLTHSMTGTRVLPIGRDRTLETFVFETGAGEHHVEWHACWFVHERHHSSAPYEVGIADGERRARRPHVARTMLWRVRHKGGRHIRVRAEPGTARVA